MQGFGNSTWRTGNVVYTPTRNYLATTHSRGMETRQKRSLRSGEAPWSIPAGEPATPMWLNCGGPKSPMPLSSMFSWLGCSSMECQGGGCGDICIPRGPHDGRESRSPTRRLLLGFVFTWLEAPTSTDYLRMLLRRGRQMTSGSHRRSQ